MVTLREPLLWGRAKFRNLLLAKTFYRYLHKVELLCGGRGWGLFTFEASQTSRYFYKIHVVSHSLVVG